MSGEVLMLVLIFLAIVVGGVVWARNEEKKAWNGGVCAKCGGKWQSFDTDSQGGRGYNCASNKHTIWISYNVDGRGMRIF